MSHSVEILSVGTELLLGNIANLDAQILSQGLSELGLNVYWHTVVGDNPQRAREAVSIAKKRADIIITTGGLGPTCDDLTKNVLAESFGKRLVFHEPSAQRIRSYFTRTGRTMTDNNLQQAMLPEGCTCCLLYTSVEDLGAAAQSLAEGGSGDRHDHKLLNLHVVGGVGAAVENVHHRHGQLLGVDTADIVVQAGPQALSGSLGTGQRGAEDGVGPQAALVGGAVQVNEHLVDGNLIQHIGTDQGLGDLSIYVLNRGLNTFAHVAALVAVAQLTGLIDTLSLIHILSVCLSS